MRSYLASAIAVVSILLSMEAAGAGVKGAARRAGAKDGKGGAGEPEKKPDQEPDKKAEKPGPTARLTVSSTRPKPGDPILVKVTGVAAAPRGTGGRHRLVFFPVRGGWQAVFGVPLDGAPEPGEDEASRADPRRPSSPWWWKDLAAEARRIEKAPRDVTLKVAIDGTDLVETLVVRDHAFPKESIAIDPALAEPPASQAREIDADNRAVIAALKNSDPPLFGGRFRPSASGKRSSTFGSWRQFNEGLHRSRHLGLDVVARKGAPIRAVERGRVALVRAGVLMGGTVVVVHGAGLASAYFHVSDFSVKSGEVVERGAVLGKVGLTGRTTGPHIHIGIWATGGFVDPAVFFKLPISPPLAPEPSAGDAGAAAAPRDRKPYRRQR